MKQKIKSWFSTYGRAALIVAGYMLFCVLILPVSFLISALVSGNPIFSTLTLSLFFSCWFTIFSKRRLIKRLGDEAGSIIKRAGFIFVVVFLLTSVFMVIGTGIAIASAFNWAESFFNEAGGIGIALFWWIPVGLVFLVVVGLPALCLLFIVYSLLSCLILNLCFKFEKAVKVTSWVMLGLSLVFFVV
ncbi:MAG: hypothetical protein FWD48_07895 [Oscillospiraceae bacterium]|nr:hypothetical protein [Oscillospiraceae bacterium]